MQAKTFEIRDIATFIPVLAIRLSPSCDRDRYLFARAGFGTSSKEQRRYICLAKMNGGSGIISSDSFRWGDRTIQIAHQYIIEHWDVLDSGEVIDVQYILGETKEKKKSEEEQFGN